MMSQDMIDSLRDDIRTNAELWAMVSVGNDLGVVDYYAQTHPTERAERMPTKGELQGFALAHATAIETQFVGASSPQLSTVRVQTLQLIDPEALAGAAARAEIRKRLPVSAMDDFDELFLRDQTRSEALLGAGVRVTSRDVATAIGDTRPELPTINAAGTTQLLEDVE